MNLSVCQVMQDSPGMTCPSSNKLFLASDDDRVICGDCGHRYRLPRTLPCLHTFCSGCILNLQAYPITEENDSSHVLNVTADWHAPPGTTTDVSRNGLNIIRPPAQFESPDFDRSTLPRGRSKHIKGAPRPPRSRSCCASLKLDEGTVGGSSHSSRSLTRSNSTRSSRNRNSINTPARSSALDKSNSHGDVIPGMLSAAAANKKWVVMCPKCWREVQVSRSLKELPRNLVAERFVAEDLKLCPGTVQECGLCQEFRKNRIEDTGSSGNNVTTRCMECAENLCSHRTKHHQLIRLEHSTHADIGCKRVATAPYLRQELVTAQQYLFSKGPELLTNLTTFKLPSLHKFGKLLWDGSEKVVSQEEVVGNSVHPGTGPAGVIKCLEHEDQELKMFCVTCEQNVCLDCALQGHKNHRCQSVTKELFQNQMEEVDRLIQIVIPKVKEVDDRIKSLTQLKVTTKERSQTVMDEVNAFMDTFADAVELHRKQLLAQITLLADNEERSLSIRQSHLQQARADVEQTCQFLGELLASASDTEILSLKKLLTQRLSSLKDTPPETHFASSGLMRFCPSVKGEVINNFQMFGIVTDSLASPADSCLHGDGLSTARVSRTCRMILNVYDSRGVPYNGRDVTLAAWITYQGQAINVPVTFAHLSGHAHQLAFTPVYKGTHFLHVHLNDCSIKDSPFKFNVKAKWRHHSGTWQPSAPCSVSGCKHDASSSGGYTEGHRLRLPGHPGGHYWSCCGKMTFNSQCPDSSARSSPIRHVSF